MQNLLVIISFAAASLLLSGCSTVEGFGKDVQKAGEKIESSAK